MIGAKSLALAASILVLILTVSTSQAFTPAKYTDFDLNDDGSFDVIDLTEEANTILSGKYDYKYDINLDLAVDVIDLIIMSNVLLYAENLSAWKVLENDISKVDTIDGLAIYSASVGAVEEWFMDFCRVEKHEWYHPEMRPNPNDPNWTYVCWDFAEDTSKTAWKNLDTIGVIGVGITINDETLEGHAYNVFCISDWRKPENWYILEPQNGKIFRAVDSGLPWYYDIYDGFYFEDYKRHKTYIFKYNKSTGEFELTEVLNYTFTEFLDLGIEPPNGQVTVTNIFELWYYITEGKIAKIKPIKLEEVR